MGYAQELGNYAEYSGAPNEEEVLQYARVVLDVRIILVPLEFQLFSMSSSGLKQNMLDGLAVCYCRP